MVFLLMDLGYSASQFIIEYWEIEIEIEIEIYK
jgi:hypothetical protein